MEVFNKSILAVICLYTVSVFVYSVVSVVSRLSEINCLYAVLLAYQTLPAVYTASPGMGASPLPTVTEVAVWQEAPREVRLYELTPQGPPSGLTETLRRFPSLSTTSWILLASSLPGVAGTKATASAGLYQDVGPSNSPAGSVPVFVSVQRSLPCI